MPNKYCLEVSGDFACFTRPEMKVERVSYEVITPSAARAIFEAIFWKPAIQWQVTNIEVLKPIRWITLRRNELGSIISHASVVQAMKSGREALSTYIEEDRKQRAALILRDVHYRLHATLLFDEAKDITANYGKYAAMFERRAERGQCFNQPYLGCREFSCSFKFLPAPIEEPCAISDTRSLGWMLYDMDYTNGESPSPRFFHAEMQAGVVNIPAWNSAEVVG